MAKGRAGRDVMSTLLAAEAAEAPARIATALSESEARLHALALRLNADPPRMVLTVARGSSDAAALWLRALAETRLGWPGGSLAPSTVSIYVADVRLEGALVVLVSQSGASPDLLAVAEYARSRGALTVGLVNDERSQLASSVEVLLPLMAGDERSVAATKTCLAAFAMSLAIVETCRTGTLGEAARVSEHLARSALVDWTAIGALLGDAQSAYVVARGLGLAVATEAALKLKEVAGIHAEAVSAAEIVHGPIALAGPNMPALLFGAGDMGDASVRDAAARLRAAGSPTLVTGLDRASDVLSGINAGAPALRLMGALQAFYMALPALAACRGRNPDAPPGLTKVTRTT